MKGDPIRVPLSIREAEHLRDLLRKHTADGTYAVLYHRLDQFIQRRNQYFSPDPEHLHRWSAAPCAPALLDSNAASERKLGNRVCSRRSWRVYMRWPAHGTSRAWARRPVRVFWRWRRKG